MMMTSDDDDIIFILPIAVRISPIAPFAHVYRVENFHNTIFVKRGFTF